MMFGIFFYIETAKLPTLMHDHIRYKRKSSSIETSSRTWIDNGNYQKISKAMHNLDLHVSQLIEQKTFEEEDCLYLNQSFLRTSSQVFGNN